jgi:hypothetical protein
MKIHDKLANGIYLGASAIPGAGVGVFTGVPIGAGTPTCEYKGETFDSLDVPRQRYEYTRQSGFSTPHLIYTQAHPPSGLYIESHPALCKAEMGLGCFVNDARNHTNREKALEEKQDPQEKLNMSIEAGYNCTYFIVPNEPVIYLTAIRNIEAGEELLVNYGDKYWGPFAEAEEVQKKREEALREKEQGEKTEQKSEKESLEEKENELVST